MASNFKSFQQLLILALMLQHLNTQFSSANRPLSDEKKPSAAPKLPIASLPKPNFPFSMTAPFLQVSPSITENSPMLPPLHRTVPVPTFDVPDLMTHPMLPGLPILPPLPQMPPLPTLPLIPSIPSFPFGPGSSDASASVQAVSEDNGKATP